MNIVYACFVVLLLCGLILIKNEVTYHNRIRIGYAIFAYQCRCIDIKQPILVDYSDCESYWTTLFRMWDWGCANILPKEKFEIIKEFMP